MRRTILERRLIRRGDHVLVACSGGADSVALAQVLARLGPEMGFTVAVASVDHGLRPEAPDEVAWVGRLSAGLGLDFHPLRVSLPSAPSLQAAARAARYRALLELARATGAGRVATGHTLDDQAETVLARLLRGAGIAGLSGIAPRRRDGVVRPLIDCSRAQVRAHLDHHGMSFLSDPSNADPRFERVRIRHALLPRLAEENPRIGTHLAHLADEARASAGWARRGAERLLSASASPHVLRSARLRAAAPPVRRAALRRWVARATGRAPGRAHLEEIERALRGRGEVRLPGGGRVHAGRGWLQIEPGEGR
ncbi:MAG: tRNA lysidine(34) synthetase TilS [Myxococcota bacterium]